MLGNIFYSSGQSSVGYDKTVDLVIKETAGDKLWKLNDKMITQTLRCQHPLKSTAQKYVFSYPQSLQKSVSE